MSDLGKIAAERMREAREAAGLTQAELGDVLGISGNAVTKIENGRSTLTLQHLEQLPKILGQPLSWFLGIKEAGEIGPDEQELLRLYRSLPIGRVRKQGLEFLRAWAKHQERD